jgi:hypothetical protein
MYNFYDVQQNTDEWMELRLGKVTCSNFGTIMANYGKAFGDPAKKYAVQLALEQINQRKSENVFSNEHTERGHEQEPIARMLYEQERFCDISNGGFFCWGAYGDSPDGLVDNDGVVEIKSVIASVQYATLERGAPDPAYKWQLIGHLDCTNRQWVDYISFCADFPDDNQNIVYRIQRADVLEELEMLKTRRIEFLDLVKKTKTNIIDKLGLK